MKIDNIKISCLKSDDDALEIAKRKSRLKPSEIKTARILKKSIDARDKDDIKYVYSIEISDKIEENEKIELKKCDKRKKIIVIGFGPSGMFSALYLARAGYCPIVFERGEDVDNRKKTVDNFIKNSILNEDSNICYGEGGAGAFSDGKLNTGVSSPYIKTVLKDFVSFGAPKEIEYIAKPHIGSDNLPKICKNIRCEIERLGGRVYFNHKVENFVVKNGKITAVIVNNEEIEADDVILAVGHSARDTYRVLKDKVDIEKKAFAVGVRIEHLKRDIDVSQYGEKFADVLPSADYRLASHGSSRGVFTFCMCPGGFVMPSSTEQGGVVVNGMSYYARDNVNSNSAVLCEVYPDDFSSDLFGGVEFQADLERKAYLLGGSDFGAPIQTFKDYVDDVATTKTGKIVPSYPKWKGANLNDLLPKFLSEPIKAGIFDFDRKIKEFATGDAILTGIETRSSAPIRILRSEGYFTSKITNLYPCGEGCGYAGGIMSSAIDGIKVAMHLVEKY